MALHIRKNDTVQVIAGKEKGKRGKVLKLLPAQDAAIVENIAFVKRHTRANPQRNIKGGILEKEGPMRLSNLMVVCRECGVPTRIKRHFLTDGTKVRQCRRCGGVLD